MIPKWVLKAVLQKTLSVLPAGYRVNYLFQKYVTKGVVLSDTYFFDRLQHAAAHLAYYRKHAGKAAPDTTLEIGAGWYPVVPLCNFLAGANTIYSVDIRMLTNKKHFSTALCRVVEACEQPEIWPKEMPILPERFQRLKDLSNRASEMTLEAMLQSVNMIYLVADARALNIPDKAIDLVHSNNTFEHIYPEVLREILMEFQRICGGIQSHFIDMSDHFAHFDSSIDIYHFLRFTEKQWRWIDNSIQPQNRWRFDDYQMLYKDINLNILEVDLRPGDVQLVSKTPLAKPFSEKTAATNAISHCHLVSD
jgi:hypothetical protein